MISTTEQGKKHIPGVEAVDGNLIIKIGYMIEHPMLPEHYITGIDILEMTKAGRMRVKEITLKSGDKAEAIIPLSEFKQGIVYLVQERCNLHGTFSNEFML